VNHKQKIIIAGLAGLLILCLLIFSAVVYNYFFYQTQEIAVSTPVKTPSQPALNCTDSDGGPNYYKYGEVFTQQQAAPSVVDSCQGNILQEGICTEDGRTTTRQYNCPNDCRNGVCLQNNQTSKICTDCDGSFDPYIKGRIQAYDAGGIYHDVWDQCSSSKKLIENYCNNNVFGNREVDCPGGCIDGACSPDKQTNVNNCKDSDGGYYPYVFGTVTWTDRSGKVINTKDVCIGGNKLMEAVCDSNGFADNSKTYDCPSGCSNGSCIRQPEIMY